MNKNLQQAAKEYVLDLLEYNGARPLYILCKDSCSEVSRLLGLWFRKKLPKANVFIAKGKIQNHFHDLLIIEDGEEVNIVDPTVWQFFRNKKSIFIVQSKTMEQAFKKLTNIYGGKWKMSEQVTNYSESEIVKFKQIIKSNL